MFHKSCYVLLIAFCFSCGKSQNNDSLESIPYRLERVTVDAKGHIFDLTYSLSNSHYCQQDRFLYAYNGFDHSMDKIDLDRLAWVANFPLQKEGPDGTGSWISTVKSLGNGEIFLSGEFGGVFTVEGKLIQKFDWNKTSLLGGEKLDHGYFYKQIAIPGLDNLVFALAVDHPTNTVSLKKLNLADSLIFTYDIDPNGNYKKYTLGDPTTYNKWDPRVFMTSQNDKIIVSHEFSNDFHVYSPERDQLESVSYTSIQTPGKAVVTTEGDLVNSTEDRIKALQYYLEQISFGPLVWDTENNRYYRLSSSSRFGDQKREGRILHERTHVDAFLGVFDQEFNLLGEIPIPELQIDSSDEYFVKDGMLWVFENTDDEMGFVRIELH